MRYTWEIDGERIVDATSVIRACEDHGYATQHFRGRVNVFKTQDGAKPGELCVLVTRKHLDAIKKKNWVDWKLTEYDDDWKKLRETTFRQWVPAASSAVIPGPPDSDDSIFMLTLYDWRHIQKMRSCSVAFGLRDPITGAIYTTTDRTWQTAANALWAQAGLSAITLPYTPHGKPEGLDYYGHPSALECLENFLTRINCTLRYDSRTTTWGVGRVAADRSELEAFIESKGFVVWNDDSQLWPQADYPVNVRVRFRNARAPIDGSDPYTYVNAALPVDVLRNSSEVQIDDDLYRPATFDFTALQARANERRDEWVRRRAAMEFPTSYTLAGISIEALDLVGTSIQSVAISDRGGERDGSALSTELFCYDANRFENWKVPATPRNVGGPNWGGIIATAYPTTPVYNAGSGTLTWPGSYLINAFGPGGGDIPVTVRVLSGGAPVVGATVQGSTQVLNTPISIGPIATSGGSPVLTDAAGEVQGIVRPYLTENGLLMPIIHIKLTCSGYSDQEIIVSSNAPKTITFGS